MVAQRSAEPGRHHFLLVCFPVVSHINPTLHLAGRLTSLGVRITFSTAVRAHRQMFPNDNQNGNLPLPDPKDQLLFYHPYSDGFDDEQTKAQALSPEEYMDRVSQVSSETLRCIAQSPAPRPPVMHMICTLNLPWAAHLSRDLGLPFTIFWIQPASVFLVYYYYFHGHHDGIRDAGKKLIAGDDSHNPAAALVDLPGLPCLESRDFPSFLVGTPPSCGGSIGGGDGDSRGSVSATSKADGWTRVFLRDAGLTYGILDEEIGAATTRPKVLVNSFEELEQDAVAVLSGILNFLPVGMMVAHGCTDPKATPSSIPDLIEQDDKAEYKAWLDRWPSRSVVYISFGSYSVPGKAQVDEFVKVLGAIGRPFLWVAKKDAHIKPDESVLTEKGKVVAWCSQMEVLTHGSVGCFVSHCGWNSTAEAIAAGVPMVAVPFWTEQPMNARLVDGVWKNGVRAAARPDGVVEAKELERCIELIMGDGDEGAAIRRQAARWCELAKAALSDGGSSNRNLRAFVDGVG